MRNKTYKYYQPNKKDIKDNYGDCVIRALTAATGKEWIEVFDELIPYARELQCMPNNDVAYKKYLEENGFKKGTIRIVKGKKRPTVESFAKEHKSGTYILSLANHLVAVVDGKYYDTWDSGYKSVYTYYEKV